MTGPTKSEIIDVPDLKPNDNQILIKNKYCGVCMSEHYTWLTAKGGETLGHEPMGVVVEVGKNVTKFKVGDRVSGVYGGGVSEYSLSSESSCFLIPDNVRDEDAILEPLACIVSAVSKVSVGVPGDTVAVVGCGYMGCGAIGVLKIKGAGKVVAVDINRESLKNALKYGADEVYTPDELPDEYIAPMGRISKGGFNLVFEWGETNESLDLAINMTKMCGTLAVGAYHTGGNRSVNVQLLNVKAIDMLSTHPRESDLIRHCCRNALNMLSSGQWNYKNLKTKIYPMNKFDLAHQELPDKFGKYMKAIIDCTKFDGEPMII